MVRQSERFDRYDAAIDRLAARGLTYPCYCTPARDPRGGSAARTVLRPRAPIPGPAATSPPPSECAARVAGRPPALRLRAEGEVVGFTDRIAGPVEAVVDDVVLRRNDGVPAYNLAVVVDDADQRVEEVVRGDDLLLSTPRQIHLGRLLGLSEPDLRPRPDGARTRRLASGQAPRRSDPGCARGGRSQPTAVVQTAGCQFATAPIRTSP